MTDETPSPTKPSRRRTPKVDVPPAVETSVDRPAVEHGAAPALDVGAPASAEQVPVSAAEPAPAPVTAISSLRLERGGIGEATAETVEVRMGGIGALDADDVFVQLGGVGAAKAERVSVEFGSVGAAMTGELRVTQGYAGSVLAREATIEQSFVRMLVAQRVHIARPSAVLVIIAKQVTGEVRPLLDWRGAIAFGAAFGLVSGLAGLARRRG
ncbi:MAG: hypothetical protein MUQ32_08425 [Chloroflexi bacterium]|nr:hypothetical protein [Chloroflexota bacterium]